MKYIYNKYNIDAEIKKIKGYIEDNEDVIKDANDSISKLKELLPELVKFDNKYNGLTGCADIVNSAINKYIKTRDSSLRELNSEKDRLQRLEKEKKEG